MLLYPYAGTGLQPVPKRFVDSLLTKTFRTGLQTPSRVIDHKFYV